MKRIQQQILELLEKTEASGSEIALKLSINRLTITKYLNVIHALGLIDFKTVGRAKIWFLKQKEDSRSQKARFRDVVDTYKESIDVQKRMLDYLRNNPYGQNWEIIAKDLRLSKEQVFTALKVLKHNDLVSYRDKGKRAWYLNYFPTTSSLSDLDLEEIKGKVLSALRQKSQSLSSLSEQIKVDISICAQIIGVLKEQHLVSYTEKGNVKIWYVHKDLNASDLHMDVSVQAITLDGNPAFVANQSFVVGLYLTYNKEMLRRLGHTMGLYLSRLQKYGTRDADKTFLFEEQVRQFLGTGWGHPRAVRAKPFHLVIDDSLCAKTVREFLPQFSGEPACAIIPGYVEGVYEVLFGQKVRLIEEKCIAKGDASCEFTMD